MPGNEGGGISQTDEDLVPYHGPIEHIFFHPLVIYPELAFDGDRMSRGYDDWFVTVKEFKAIIDSLYKHNFMLIDLNSIYELQEADGKKQTKAKELRLPKGKKPIVLSIDDMNYYDYMLQNGNANKLVIDDNGEIATYSVSPKGEKITSRDNEIVPILDDFVKVHPDFSLNGAKGLIALTGYEGVLGYRTNKKDAPNYEEEKQGALRIIDRLKSTGWSFASHGYGHLDARKVGLDRLTEDTARWKDEVETLTGPTNIYVYPFGSSVLPGDPKYAALLKAGFTVLCSVGPAPYLKWMPDSLMMDRRHIDGIALKTQQSKLVDMFDANEVLDPVRAELLDSMH
ncbi:hypothetical protein ACFFK0_12760 [Paenibacillus chartarius]|uniref:NodB homology domain-containing protein n=1 Tax=Paenibacillus chartarius TaxID=747481 RepID=A0ABV6DL34_9BACL